MITIEQQQKLFLDLARALPRAITVYAIGGTAMMFLGLKNNTVDVDLVFMDKRDRDILKEAAIFLGYREFEAKIVYGAKPNKPLMISLGDVRLDLFLYEVINTKFSNEMRGRALDTHTFDNNLIVKIANVHDIVIMKCATGRFKDEDDIVNIVRNSRIDWNIAINEAENQLKEGNEGAVLGLGTILERLGNQKKINVPKEVLDKLWRLLKRQVREKRKK